MVLLGSLDFVDLCGDSLIVGGSSHIANHAEGDGEAVAVAHEGQFQLQGVVLAVGIVDENVVEGVAVLANLHDLQAEALLHEAELVVLAEDELLAVADIDGILLAAFLVIDAVVGAVVEDDAVLQDLADAGSLVVVGGLQHLDGTGGIGGHSAGEEMAAGAEAELSGAEGIFDGAIGAGLGYEATRRGGAVLPFREAVDAVVQQNHVEVDVAAVGVDEVVAADGEAVAVAADLPHVELGVGDLGAGGDGGGAPVDGVHAVGGHVMGQTAAAADAADDGDVLGCHADFGQCLVQTGEEEVISATRTPPRLPFLIVFTFHITFIL